MEPVMGPEPPSGGIPPGETTPGTSSSSDGVAATDVRVDAFTTVVVNNLDVCADTVADLIHTGALDVEGLRPRERNVVLQLCEVARRRAGAAMSLVVDVADRTGSHACDGHASVRGWGKALCRCSNHDARSERSLMQLLRGHELTRDEYLAGRLGRSQALLLAKLALHPRAGDRYRASEALLVEDAQMMGYEDFKAVTDRWLMLADLDGADQDEALKHHLRNGCVITGIDQMTHLDAQFAGAQGATLKAIFERFFQAETDADVDAVRAQYLAEGDERSVCKNDLPRTDEQRRADALYAIFLRAGSTPPGSKAPEPVVNVLVDHDTLNHLITRAFHHNHDDRGHGHDDHGHDDHGDHSDHDHDADSRITQPIDPATYRSRRCETLDGHPVAPSDIVAAATIGQVRRVVMESPSTVIDLGRRQRLFTGSARAAAKLQHPRCTYPGCGLPADWCQIDHVDSWHDHGITAPHNAQTSCGRHNRWKELGFHTWQDTTGHWHTLRPDDTEIRAV